MSKQESFQLTHIYLSQDDINIILDALNVLYQDVEVDPVYNRDGRAQALLEIWSLLDSFFQLYTLSTESPIQVSYRGHPILPDTTITYPGPG